MCTSVFLTFGFKAHILHSGKMAVNHLAFWQKENNASKKIWEFVVPEIFRILVTKPTELAQKLAILCEADTFV